MNSRRSISIPSRGNYFFETLAQIVHREREIEMFGLFFPVEQKDFAAVQQAAQAEGTFIRLAASSAARTMP